MLATSATAFTIVKWCGAAFLLYTGVRLLMSSLSRETEGNETAAPRPLVATASAARIFREGLLINVLNPKVALFFLAFLPQFIEAGVPSPALAFLFLGTLFNVNSLFVNLPVAWLAAQAGRRSRRSIRLARALHGAVGVLFVALAARLAAFGRN